MTSPSPPNVDLIPTGIEVKMAGAPPQAVAAKVRYAVVLQGTEGGRVQSVGSGELDLGLIPQVRLQDPLNALVQVVHQVLREQSGLAPESPVALRESRDTPMSDHPNPDAPDEYGDDPL